MTTGFQQQQQASFSFPRTIRAPQQVGQKLETAPPRAVQAPKESPSFK